MKNKLTYSFLLLVVVTFLFTHCSIQKRNYTSGYYVSSMKKPVKVNETKSRASNRASQNSVYLQTQSKDTKVSVQQEMGLMASAGKVSREHTQKLSIRPLPCKLDTCGERIVFRDGSEVIAKVYEIGTNTIKYKPCDNLDGPMMVCSKDKVFLIRYTNGNRELFQPKAIAEIAPVESNIPTRWKVEEKKANNAAKAGFILAFFSWTIVLAPVSVVLGIVGLSKAIQDKDKHSGMWMAIFAILITVAIIALILTL